VPARPQVTRAETKTQIAEGLVADTPQAGYSSEVILRQGATAGSLMALAPVAQRQVAPEIAKGIRPLPLPTVKPLLARQRVAALPEKPRKPVVQASAVASSVADVFRARVAEQSRLPSQMTSEAGAGVQAGLGVVGILERPSAPVVSSTAVASSIADVFRARIAEQSRLPLQVASGDGSGVQAGLGGTVYISSAGVVGPANAGRQVSLPHFGMEKVATIIFSNGSWKLSETDLKILADVSALHRLRGGAVNVVGHASSRTKTMDEGRHHQVNLKISLSRADSVARALIRMGLPRDAISIDARADSEPLYHEVMPTGEAGNRRAEIYLEL
jgi:outer membrane protein OmpA-like peptidoglycan-associated protein